MNIVRLPAQTDVHVELTSRTSACYQKVVITWPGGGQQVFETEPVGAGPGPAVVYGQTDYTTGGVTGALVDVQVDIWKSNNGASWSRSHVTYVPANGGTEERLEARDHESTPPPHDDSIVRFAWG